MPEQPLKPEDEAWDAAIEQALRAIDVRLRTAPEPCRRLLTTLRFDLTLLLRRPPPTGLPH